MSILRRALSTAARVTRRPPWTPSPSLKYALRPLDESLRAPSRWMAPMGGTEALPFRVFRTARGRQLPVYTDYRNGRTRCLTIVRRLRGDVRALADELSLVCDGAPVDVRPGRLQVKGNYRSRVTEWLLRLGF